MIPLKTMDIEKINKIPTKTYHKLQAKAL